MSPTRRRMAGVIVGCFSISMLLSIPIPAAGQARSDAQKLYDEGIALRAKGKHDEAVDRLRRSLAIEHRPQTYVALASELFELDKNAEALAAIDALYAEFDGAMKPQTQAKADRARQVIEEGMGFGRIAITMQEKGTLFVDGPEAGALPLASSLRLKEGPHSLRIVRQGAEPLVRDVVVAKGETLTIEVPPLPAPVVEPKPVPKPIETAPKVVQTAPPSHSKPVENPRAIKGDVKNAPKTVTMPQSRTRVYLGAHVSFMGGLGKTDTFADAPPTTCGVYCLPSTSLLAGIDAGISIRERLLLRVGAEYVHATSTLHVAWSRPGFTFMNGTADATMNLDHVFSLDGALVHAAIGTSAPLGKHVRIEGSIGPGVFIGQSMETVSGTIQPNAAAMQSSATPVNVPETMEKTATIVLPVLRPRLGVSFNIGRVWLGIAAEGVLSLTRGPAMCTPQLTANQTTLEASGGARIDQVDCPDGTRSARPFERLFIASPAASIGTSF